jgi:hypothetical protein
VVCSLWLVFLQVQLRNLIVTSFLLRISGLVDWRIGGFLYCTVRPAASGF